MRENITRCSREQKKKKKETLDSLYGAAIIVIITMTDIGKFHCFNNILCFNDICCTMVYEGASQKKNIANGFFRFSFQKVRQSYCMSADINTSEPRSLRHKRKIREMGEGSVFVH